MKPSLLDIPHNVDNPAGQGGMRAGDPGQDCTAAAGKLSRASLRAGGAGKPLGRHWTRARVAGGQGWGMKKPALRRAVERGSVGGPYRT